MRHRVKLTRFKGGRDASRMMLKKLMINFLKQSQLVSSDKKIKTIKSQLEKVITLSKESTESNKNRLLTFFNDKKIVDVLFDQVGKACVAIPGGYLKASHLNQRQSDATNLMKLEWAHPVKIEWSHASSAVKKSKKAEISSKKNPSKKIKKVEITES